jgi:hypothetical protein
MVGVLVWSYGFIEYLGHVALTAFGLPGAGWFSYDIPSTRMRSALLLGYSHIQLFIIPITWACVI